MVALAGSLFPTLLLLSSSHAAGLSARTVARLAAATLVASPLVPLPATAVSQSNTVIVEAFVELPASSQGNFLLLQVLGDDRMVAGARLRVDSPGLFRLQLMEENLLVNRDEWERRYSGQALRLRGSVCRGVEGRECIAPLQQGETSSEVVRTPGDRLVRLTPAIVLR